MKRQVLGVLFFMLFIPGLWAQGIRVYDSFEDFENLLHRDNDTTYVINFWATYCGPCIKEMPAFKRLEEEFGYRQVKIILTSLDFGKHVRERVRSFMHIHDVRSQVVILDDPHSNSWIDKVSKSWSGNIPATLIYNKNYREFFEKPFTYNELLNVVKPNMIKP